MEGFENYHVMVDTIVTARLDHPRSEALYRAYRARRRADLPFIGKCYEFGYSAGYCATMVEEGA